MVDLEAYSIFATCEVSQEALDRLKKFRFMRTDKMCALIFKIDINNLVINEEEFLEDTTLEDLVDELPENQPRYPYVVYHSYYHYHLAAFFKLELKDGRITNPLVFIYYNRLASSRLNMLYASSKTNLEREAGATKVVELREAEQLNMEWLRGELAL
ncbi:hypothetical protein BDF22DRAFT_742349 [Syncephalis plumigaleata]|nr:hypothetical protein BDF22DRAFT_742349 [Syncephalis plumigaleata]